MPPLQQPASAAVVGQVERRGLDGAACPERAGLDQGYAERPPRQRCCCRCGRVTHRVDEVGLPWCGGEAT